MDQRISFKNKLFNRVVFQYVDAAEDPIDLIEVIDDVEVGPLCTVARHDEQRPHLNGTSGSDVICGDDRCRRDQGPRWRRPDLRGAGNDTVPRRNRATTTSTVVPARTSCTATVATTCSTVVSRTTSAPVAPGGDSGLLCEVKIGIPLIGTRSVNSAVAGGVTWWLTLHRTVDLDSQTRHVTLSGRRGVEQFGSSLGS